MEAGSKWRPPNTPGEMVVAWTRVVQSGGRGIQILDMFVVRAEICFIIFYINVKDWGL